MIRIRKNEKERNRNGRSVLILLLIAFFVCLYSGMPALYAAEPDTLVSGDVRDPASSAQADPVSKGENAGKTASDSKEDASGKTASDRKGETTGKGGAPEVTIETVRLTETSGTVIVSAKNGNISCYYVLIKEDGQSIPTAAEIKKEGIKSVDGFISLPPQKENVEYIFYVVAEDEAGNLSDVVSKRGASSASTGIEIAGHIYCALQAREEIDDYINEPGLITINVGSAKNIKKIEYIIADKFVNAEGMIEAIATEKQDVTTASGTSQLTFSKWSEYDPKEKPGLVRNMLNYVYVRMTDTEDAVTYVSSRGIWEDETAPTAMSVSAEADETSAVVTVTGDDEESGIRTFYFLLRDPIDISPLLPEDVKKQGMESEDGIFTVTGLTKRTRYELYAVVEDMAGNLSEIRDGMVTTEGEPTASAVRPSSDSSSNPGSTSNVSKRTDGVSLDDPETVETVPERTPFLVTSEERKNTAKARIAGWDNIKAAVSKSVEPADIYINMNGGAVVPGYVLEDVSGRNISYHFIMDDAFTWVVNGRDFTTVPMSTDFRISQGSSHIPAKLITELAGVYPREEFTIEHAGAFGFTTILDISLGMANAGKNAHLYTYNENDYTLEHLNSVVVSDRGQASFSLPDKTDFVVIVGPVAETDQPEERTSEPEVVPDNGENEFINTKKSSGTLWIVITSIIAVLLFIFILFFPRDKGSAGTGNDGEVDESEGKIS